MREATNALSGLAALRVSYENNTCPYKESVTVVQIQMPFYAVMRSWTLLPPLMLLLIYFHHFTKSMHIILL